MRIFRRQTQKLDSFCNGWHRHGSATHRIFGWDLEPLKTVFFLGQGLVWASIVLATLGIFVLGTAVKPRLRKASLTSNEGLHYFGHVASYAGHWLKLDFAKQRPAEFDAALAKASNDVNYEQRLRDQIWFLGCIVFRKYKLISVSMWVFAASLACGGVAVLFEVTK